MTSRPDAERLVQLLGDKEAALRAFESQLEAELRRVKADEQRLRAEERRALGQSQQQPRGGD